MNEVEQYLANALALFGNPAQWTRSSAEERLPGLDRPQVFQVSAPAELTEVLASIEEARIRKVAIVGLNPTAFMAAFELTRQKHEVTLLPSGREVPAVQALLPQPEVAAFFDRHGISFRLDAAKRLRGSQVHCQSGYCGFVCEGRFIEESEEVGCVLTESGPIFADAVIVAES